MRALVDDAASPATAADGTVLGKVRRSLPRRRAAGARCFSPCRCSSAIPHTARDPTFAVQDTDGSPLLRLVFSGQEVRVRGGSDADLGALVNAGRPRR